MHAAAAAQVPLPSLSHCTGREWALSASHTPDGLRGAHLIDADLSGMDLTGADLSGANLSRADLTGACLAGATLDDAVLFEAQLSEAEFAGASLVRANLCFAKAARAGFGAARLIDAKLDGADCSGASFTGACLRGASLTTARLADATVVEAELSEADLTRADLRQVDLGNSRISGARLDNADLRSARLFGVRGFESASFIGTDLRDINFAGAYLLRRFANDQNYLAEFRTKSSAHKWVYWLWWATSDCGRSVGRWSLWIAVLTVLFAFAYMLVPVDYGDYQTALSPLYFSVVTMTTLGYGDVLPASEATQTIAMVQVLCGYVMLGGLLSIFSNKMARRAD